MNKIGFITLLCMAFLSSIIGYVLIGQNLQAKFFYVDDHEIPYYLDGKSRMKITDLNTALQKTEFYSFGRGARFRPVYALLRVTETILWGNNPTLWYFARFVIFVFSFWVFWLILKRYIGIILGLLLIMSTLTLPFWTDIWTRLGPGEIYCVPALAVFLWAYTALFNDRKNSTIHWLLLFLGSTIMIGSKETFVFLLPLIVFLDGYLLIKKRMNTQAIIFSLLTIAFILFVMAGVGIYISKTGVDFYIQNAGLGTRFMNLSANLTHHAINITKRFMGFILITLITFGIIAFYFIRHAYSLDKAAKRRLKYGTWQVCLIVFWIIFIVISQIYLYNGAWPTGTRYDFPGILGIPMLFIALYRFLRIICGAYKLHLAHKLCFVATVTVLTAEIWIVGYRPLVTAGDINVTRTIEFSIRLDQIQKELSVNTSIPIIYTSCGPEDYEFITSINRFLSQNLLDRTVYLTFDYKTPTNASKLDKYLADSLRTRSIGGNEVFKPISQMPKTSHCYAINFSCPSVSCDKSMSLVQPWCVSTTNSKYTSPSRLKLANTNCRL